MKIFSSLLLPIAVSGFFPFHSNNNLINVNGKESLNNICEKNICNNDLSFFKYHENSNNLIHSDKIDNKFQIL